MYKINIIDMVKVKRGVAPAIKEMVSDKHFYRVSEEEQIQLLDELAQTLVDIYGRERRERFGDIHVKRNEELRYGDYDEDEMVIYIGKPSVITFLNFFRVHLHKVGGVGQSIDNENFDRMAWAARAFKLACPKSFEKSVKNGGVKGFFWDEEDNRAVVIVPDMEAYRLQLRAEGIEND